MTTTARLFTALWPTPRERAEAAAWSARCRWPARAMPVPSGRLHVTLHFLGAVERPRIGAVLDALPGGARDGQRRAVPHFTLAFDTPAIWRGGLAVLQARELPAALAALHGELGARLAALGLHVETRPFRPHLTLARNAGGSAATPWPPDAPALLWRPRRVVLVESLPGAAPHYRIVSRA